MKLLSILTLLAVFCSSCLGAVEDSMRSIGGPIPTSSKALQFYGVYTCLEAANKTTRNIGILGLPLESKWRLVSHTASVSESIFVLEDKSDGKKRHFTVPSHSLLMFLTDDIPICVPIDLASSKVPTEPKSMKEFASILDSWLNPTSSPANE